jgi:hypothetical protein
MNYIIFWHDSTGKRIEFRESAEITRNLVVSLVIQGYQVAVFRVAGAMNFTADNIGNDLDKSRRELLEIIYDLGND